MACAWRRRRARDDGGVRWREVASDDVRFWQPGGAVFLLRAVDVFGEEKGQRGYIAEGHRSRAVASPGTYDSLFPGDTTARDL